MYGSTLLIQLYPWAIYAVFPPSPLQQSYVQRWYRNAFRFCGHFPTIEHSGVKQEELTSHI